MGGRLRLRVSCARTIFIKRRTLNIELNLLNSIFGVGRSAFSLFVAQRFYRIEARREVSGDQSGERTNQKRADADDRDVMGHNLRGDLGKLVDLARENFDVQRAREPVAELVAVANQRHPERETGKGAERADHGPLAEKYPNDLRDICAQRFHNSDFAPFLHRDSDERAHDSKGRDDDDKEEQEKHYIALQSDRFEELLVEIDPRLRVLGRLKKLLDRLFYMVGGIRIVRLDGDAVEGVAKSVKFLADVERHEQKI